MKWRTICFDLDNTLYSHEEAFEEAIRSCYAELVIRWKHAGRIVPEVPGDMWFPHFKASCDRYWQAFETRELTANQYRRLRYQRAMEACGLPFEEQEADWFHERYTNIVNEFCKPFPQLAPFLSNLRQKQIKLGIITNGAYETQMRKIKQLELLSYIEENFIFISERVGLAKPDRRLFDYVLQRMQGEKTKALFVGDTWEHDVTGAIDAGWDAIYLNTRNKPTTTDHRPVAICHDFEELAHIIGKES